MAETVVGFKFADDSFFDIRMKKEYWDRVRSGEEGNGYIQCLAGQLASENDISLTSYQITEVREGGYSSGKGLPLRQLHQSAPQEQNENAEGGDEENNVEKSWTNGAILLLMDTYAKHKEKFASPTVRKGDVWKKIASVMAASGCHFAPVALEKKWSNMKIRYKTIVDSNKKTGQGRSRWNYYSRMAEILEGDPSVTPPVTISSMGGVKVNTLSEISNIQRGATPTKEPYQEQQGMSQETPVCRKRRRSNNELSEQFQSYFERSLAIQEAMLVEERKRTELLEKVVENLRKS